MKAQSVRRGWSGVATGYPLVIVKIKRPHSKTSRVSTRVFTFTPGGQHSTPSAQKQNGYFKRAREVAEFVLRGMSEEFLLELGKTSNTILSGLCFSSFLTLVSFL